MNYAFCIKFRCTTLIEHCKGNTKVFISPNNLAENRHSLTSFNFASHHIVATLLYLCAGKMPTALSGCSQTAWKIILIIIKWYTWQKDML